MGRRIKSEYIALSDDHERRNCPGFRTTVILILGILLGSVTTLYLRDKFGGENSNTNFNKSTGLNEESSKKSDSDSPGVIKNCEPVETPKFDTKYSRISEVKCKEYRWQLENMEKIENYEVCQGKKSRKEKHMGNLQDYRHMGAVGWRLKNEEYIFLCGCSLISDRFAISAARCIYVTSTHSTLDVVKDIPEIVRFGTRDVMDNTSPYYDAHIEMVIAHDLFAQTNDYDDIALVNFTDPVIFGAHIQPACLWQYPSVNDPRVLVSGWEVKRNKYVWPSNFYEDNVTIFESKTCATLNRFYEDKTQFCGADRVKKNTSDCQIDLGGPMQKRSDINEEDAMYYEEDGMYYILGISSVSSRCNQYLDGISIYTKVFSYIDWIEKVVWGSSV